MAGNHANRTWQSDLVARHPRLFDIPFGGPEAAQGYPSCKGGWQDIIERARAAGAVAPALLMVGEVAGRAASAVAENVSTGTSNA